MSEAENKKAPLGELGTGLTHLFYPRLCEGCSKPLLQEEEILCLNCSIYNLPPGITFYFVRYNGAIIDSIQTNKHYASQEIHLQNRLFPYA